MHHSAFVDFLKDDGVTDGDGDGDGDDGNGQYVSV